MQTIQIGNDRIVIDGEKATLYWDGQNREIALCAYTDEKHENSTGESKIFKRSSGAFNQPINLGKVVGKDFKKGATYHFVAIAKDSQDKPASFEWKKPEVVTNAPTPPPTEESAPESKPPAPPTVTETLSTEVAPPTDTTDTKATPEDLVLTAVSERFDVIEAAQKLWNEKHKKGKFVPSKNMLACMAKGLTEIGQILSKQSHPKFNQAKERKHNCDVQLRLFKEIRQISDDANKCQKNSPASTSSAPIPAPAAPSIPTPVPAPAQPPTPDLSGKVEKLEEGLGNLGIEVGNIGKRVTDVSNQVTGLDSVLKTGIADLTKDLVKGLNEALAGLKTPPSPATTAVAPTPATPTTQPVLPATTVSTPSSDSGSGTGDNGGQTSVTPPPQGGGKSWWKKARGPICFLAFVLGLVLGLVTLVMVYFHADRSQTLDAERSNAAGVRNQANAEIDLARRTQVEAMDAVHRLQQEVEGMRRQQQMAPPQLPSTGTRDGSTTSTGFDKFSDNERGETADHHHRTV